MSSAAHTSKVRIYDLAKELKMESKRLIEEVRREGVDVSAPATTNAKALAEKTRNKFFPKKEPTGERAIRGVKKAKPRGAETPAAPEAAEAPVPEVYAEAEPAAEAPATERPADAPTGGAVRPLAPRVKTLAPAARARHPVPAPAPAAPAPSDGSAAAPAPEITEADEPVVGAEESAPAAEQMAPPSAPESQQQPAQQPPPPGRQVRTLPLTDA